MPVIGYLSAGPPELSVRNAVVASLLAGLAEAASATPLPLRPLSPAADKE